MKINRNFIISLLITITLVVFGAAACIIIHKNISLKSSRSSSKLGDVAEALSAPKPKNLKAIIHENQKLVVSLEVKNGSENITGSGFLYDTKGDIVTNAHVVNNGSSITIKMADTTTYKGKLIGKSEITDVALVRVDNLRGKSPMKILKNKKADIGDEIIALGSPLGLQNTATTGIISGLNRSFNLENYQYKNVYQISAPISPGNSGGPLLDRNTGQVIGINSAKVDTESIGFSIPIAQVIPMIDNWAANPNTYKSSPEDITSDKNQKPTNEDAAYLVSYFYNSLNSNDYVTAYSLLGAGWQQSTAYDDFRKGYLQTVSVKIDNMICGGTNNGNIEVSATIQAVEGTEPNSKTSKYNVVYNVGYENNNLKILDGKSTVIE
ncbi:S1C family serine protease [Clostridium sp. JNZ X4-2]